PGAEVLALVLEQFDQPGLIDPPRDAEGPEGAELAGIVGMVAEDRSQGAVGGGQILAGVGALLEDSPTLADVPVVLVQLELNEPGVGRARQVDWGGPGAVVDDLVDAAVLAVGAVGVVLVALAGVGPVCQEHAAVGAVLQFEAAEPVVVRQQEVAVVAGDVA